MSLEVIDSSKFEKYVQYYLILDQEIEKQQEQLKKIKLKRAELHSKIIDIMKNNSWEKSVLDAGIYKLHLVEKKQYTSLSFSYIEKCLDMLLSNKNSISVIMNKIKSEREVKTSFELKKETNP